MIRRTQFTLPRRIAAQIFVVLLVSVSTLTINADDQLAKLRDIQKQIESVAESNMETCVAIRDRNGFGSGVIVSADGLVLTAGHVLAAPTRNYEVIFPSGRRMKAVQLGMNLNVDAGMLQIIGAKDLPFVEIAESPPKPGDWTVSLGHSGGFEVGRKPPVRTGKFLRVRGYQMVTDAVLIGGDSGGPLFNLSGDLIGIHSSIGGTVAENRHVRIAIFQEYWSRMKSGDVWGELPELKKSKPKKRPAPITRPPMLGVTVDKRLNNGQILSVRPGSPAADIGLLEKDIVREFNGHRVKSSDHLIELVKQTRGGDVCSITILRNGKLLKHRIQMRALGD